MLPAVLIPILAEIGAPLLKRVLSEALPDGVTKDLSHVVVDTIASKIGVKPTPEAIADAYQKAPDVVAEEVLKIEETFGAEWLAMALSGRDKMIEREDSRDSFFAWAWRPAMSWLQIWLWAWNTTVRPLVNAAFHSTLPEVPYEVLVSFAGIWLVIYGGGHTIKSVFGKGP